MSANLRKKSFKLFKNPEKNNSWADLGPRSAWEKLSQMFVRSGGIPIPGQTSIGKTNDCPMNLNGARSLGAPTSDGYQVSSSVIYHVIYRWHININITVLFLISWYGIMWYIMLYITWYIIYQVIYLIYHMIWYGCGQVWNNTAVCACWALDTSCGMPSAPTSNTYRSLRTCISLLFSPDTGVVAVAHPHTPMSWLDGCTWQTKNSSK